VTLVQMAVAAGVIAGALYTLSPLTMVALAAGALMTHRVARELGAGERRWFMGIIIAAMVLRGAAIAWLFLSADPSRPYAVFFGDEELFKSRPIWIRNLGLGIPISGADYIYSFDETGRSGYLFVLAALQAIFGDTPYAIHVLNSVIYLGGVLLLYRPVRRAFGPLPAIGGLAILLFLPSLFAWSISALKEPLYVGVAAFEVVCVLQVVRGRTLMHKVAAVAGVLLAAYLLESLRKGGLLVAAAGVSGALLLAAIAPRPRLLLASALLAPVLAIGAWQVPAVQSRALGVLRDSVRYHAGHVLTVGYTYQLVNPHYYYDWPAIFRIGPAEAAQYVARATAHYVAEPLPWALRSRAMLAYMPEYAAWWVLLLLAPFGIAAGLKKDALLASTLLAHAVAIAMMVALTSGNIGTLIRHRGLVLPYLVWLAALGGCWWLARFTREAPATGHGMTHGNR
jgi:hypothetical protein